MEKEEFAAQQFDRRITLALVEKIASRLKRGLNDLAMACDIDPDALAQEIAGDPILTQEDFQQMKDKLVFWVDREVATLARLKADVINIPLK